MSVRILDVEELLLAWLGGLADCSVEMPNQTPLPFILVAQLPAGGDDRVTATASVQVDVFHDSRTGASDLAKQVHSRMHDLTPKVSVPMPSGGSARIDHVTTIQAPAWVNYQDPTVQRYVLRFEVASRLITL